MPRSFYFRSSRSAGWLVAVVLLIGIACPLFPPSLAFWNAQSTIPAAGVALPVETDAYRATRLALPAIDLTAPPRGELREARRETSEEHQISRLQAALRDWAARDLEAAAEWALAQSAIHHDLALSAVIQGGAIAPDRLAVFVRQLSERFPERAPDYGSYFIAALSQVAAHEKAADFAVGGDENVAVNWLTAAYSAWGVREPDRALEHLAKIPDASRRSAAFQAAVSGWARTAPAELVALAEYLSGPEQRFALLVGMHAWIERDPTAAAAWIAKAPPHIEWERIMDQ
jgi:hypothetical protein